MPEIRIPHPAIIKKIENDRRRREERDQRPHAPSPEPPQPDVNDDPYRRRDREYDNEGKRGPNERGVVEVDYSLKPDNSDNQDQ